MDNSSVRFDLGGLFAPVGWNFCDGTLLSIAENNALYALLGNTFGVTACRRSPFPDLRGRVPVHVGPLSGGPTYSLGQTGGAESVTLLAAQMPAHTHTMAVSTVAGASNDPTNNVLATPKADCLIFRETTATLPLAAGHVAVAGASQPHDNMQPYLAMYYIIATEGVFPSQG